MAGRAKPGGESAAPTPMMAQYFALKEQAGDCLLFYRMGDFFELFFDDARAAAAVLDIALTARGEHLGNPVPMCGVPVHAAESYLARLIRAGHRVAIAEQIESPAEAKARGSKALVARAIVRVVTAGTLTEEALLDARRSNWLVALAEAGGTQAIAAADISTGRFELGIVDPDSCRAELARLNPAELLIAEGSNTPQAGATHRPRGDFNSAAGAERLAAIFSVEPSAFSRAEQAAAAGLLAYLDHAGRGKPVLLTAPVRRQTAAHMAIDAATRASLEITANQSGGRTGSLLACVDRTITGAGARLLAEDLGAPLCDIAAIEARLDSVMRLIEDEAARSAVRETLKTVPDIGRALARIAAGRGSPRDLGQLRDGLNRAWHLRERLARLADLPALLTATLEQLGGHGELIDLLTRALVPAPPVDAGQGGYIAAGYDAALDALRATAGDGRRAIAMLEARYRAATGINSLKIRHNNVLGYHIEVPARSADPLMAADSGFIHRQTMAGAVRFNAPELHDEAQRVGEAGAHALAAEAAHLEDLCETALRSRDAIAATADALARIDVSAALAERAIEGGWCRPHFVDAPVLDIAGGRHPVVEEALAKRGERFVDNDCALTAEQRLWLITGPNMGGKSTFLRQNALIAVLAQSGCPVPARRATLGLVDRLFSRVGASDNLARGQSTFMVEMVETAAILAQATPASLVILDEVGRGTSTYDGLAIAWAVVETIHDANRCRCLFATHYHELTRLSERLDAVALRHARAREWQGELVLLHEIGEGPADRSYGLAVARLAGLPPATVARAKAILDMLEAGRAKTGGLAAGLDDLPLFAAMTTDTAPAADPLREALAAIEADALTPREALELVYRLKTIERK